MRIQNAKEAGYTEYKELYDSLCHELELTEYQRRILWYDGEFYPLKRTGVVFFKERETKEVWYIRITFPIYIAVYLLLGLVVMPIKWLITGKWYFRRSVKIENAVIDFMEIWTDKIGIR